MSAAKPNFARAELTSLIIINGLEVLRSLRGITTRYDEPDVRNEQSIRRYFLRRRIVGDQRRVWCIHCQARCRFRQPEQIQQRPPNDVTTWWRVESSRSTS